MHSVEVGKELWNTHGFVSWERFLATAGGRRAQVLEKTWCWSFCECEWIIILSEKLVRYLVDPASSHMLVSKIKPCMSKYKLLYGETADGSLKQLLFPWWFPCYMDNRSNSRANTCRKALFWVGFIRSKPNALLGAPWWIIVTCLIAWLQAGDISYKFLPYQLLTVRYWPTVALTGNGELGFGSGEGAWETATTSKEGSRRANYPILTQGGSDKK